MNPRDGVRGSFPEYSENDLLTPSLGLIFFHNILKLLALTVDIRSENHMVCMDAFIFRDKGLSTFGG